VLLRPIAYRALAKLPANRYPSAKELLADLEAARLQIFPTGSVTGATDATLTTHFRSRSKKVRCAPFHSTLVNEASSSSLSSFHKFAKRLTSFLATGHENHIAVLPLQAAQRSATDAVAQGLMDFL
jgi:hypothetical protein